MIFIQTGRRRGGRKEKKKKGWRRRGRGINQKRQGAVIIVEGLLIKRSVINDQGRRDSSSLISKNRAETRRRR